MDGLPEDLYRNVTSTLSCAEAVATNNWNAIRSIAVRMVLPDV